jgi:hypothetical protein
MPSNPMVDTCAGGKAAGVSAGCSARARTGAVAQSAGATGGHVARGVGTTTGAKAVHGDEGGRGGLIMVETQFRLNLLERGLINVSFWTEPTQEGVGKRFGSKRSVSDSLAQKTVEERFFLELNLQKKLIETLFLH